MISAFVNCIKDFNGWYYLTIKTRDEAAGHIYDEFTQGLADVTVEKPRKKRSLNANAYMWELCGKIADKLSDEGTLHTKEDVYREAVRQVGVFRDIPMLNEGAETLQKAWKMHGTGWITEIVDYLTGNIGYLVRCYYGSSTYNTKQMSRLIDCLIQDCDSMGIDHRTPEEINNMLSLWEQERKKNVG